ncbi:TPA: hypothetical protein ENS27_16620, partial [bacterium]|nr:hypothetical protein [bacterium]
NTRGVIQAAPPNTKVLGWHMVFMSGMIFDQNVPDGGYYILKNSWGGWWGDKGYGYLSFEYCRRHSCFVASMNELRSPSEGEEVDLEKALKCFEINDKRMRDHLRRYIKSLMYHFTAHF